MSRVVIKTRCIQNAGRNGKSAAHLRYIQRGGTSRDGERGQPQPREPRAEMISRCMVQAP